MSTIIPSAISLLYTLADKVDAANYKLIDHMTDSSMTYSNACIQPDLTYDYFYSKLKKDWEQEVNHFLAHEEKCPSTASKLISLASISGPIIANLSTSTQNVTKLSDVFDPSKLNPSDIEDFLIDSLAGYLLDPTNATSFNMSEKLADTVIQLFMLLKSHYFCQIFDIFSYIVSKAQDKYFNNYTKNVSNLSDPTVRRLKLKNILHEDLENLKTIIKSSNPPSDTKIQFNKLLEDIASKLTGLYNF